MKTQIFSSKQIQQAAELIRKGELVAFPTETVYGLGANAFDSKAVRKIFEAKQRPCDNPLIVHVADAKDVEKIAYINDKAKKLISKFWPGPLTIILKKKDIIPKEVTAGLDSVAIRMPRNKIALKLIEFSSVPIAAPSANLSGKPSTTAFEHVYDDLNGKIAGIIKSKDCEIGLESSVVDLTSITPLLLRPGAVTLEDLKKIFPDTKLYKTKTKKPRSPGMKYRHYAPIAKVILFEPAASDKVLEYKKNYENTGKKVFVIKNNSLKKTSKDLFKKFREADKEKADYILVMGVKEKGLGLALMNRIRKAASEVVKN
jgi:L-threonylcarbamoyladenylate synthase